MRIARQPACADMAALRAGDEAVHTVKDLGGEELAQRDPLAAVSRCAPSAAAPAPRLGSSCALVGAGGPALWCGPATLAGRP